MHNIDDKIELLSSKLDGRLNLADPVYTAPKRLLKKAISKVFSTSAIQDLADNIIDFLGLKKGFKVYVLSKQTNHFGIGGSIGMYNIIGNYHQEINIIKEPMLKIKHYMAILAHEITHHFLYHYNIYLPDTKQNEMLTDIAGVYIGLGGVLYNGYKPITFITDYKHTFNQVSYKKHIIKIGYLSSKDIQQTIVKVAIVKNVKEYLKYLNMINKLKVWLHLRNKKTKTITQETQNIKQSRKVKDLKQLYIKLTKNLDIIMVKKPVNINAHDSKIIVEIVNMLSSENYKQQIDKLEKDMEKNKKSDQVDFLFKKFLHWNRVLERYST